MTKILTAQALGLTLAATLVAAATTAAPVFAQSADGPTADGQSSVSVSYADLDIGHASGAKALYARIKAAAERTCGDAPGLRLLQQTAAFEQCRDQAIRQALARVDSPAFAALTAPPAPRVHVATR